MDYGTYIKTYRILKSIPASSLCDGICTISTLSKIENKKNNISLDIVNQILKKLNNTNIELLQENTQSLTSLVNSYYEKLELNLDRIDLLDKIYKSKEKFLKSEYILFYSVVESYKNNDLYELNQSNIKLSEKIDSFSIFENKKDIYYLKLIHLIKETNINKKINHLEEESKNDQIGWITYYYADILFHEFSLKKSIQVAQNCYNLACKNCNIHLMYGSLLLLGLCSLNLQEENEKLYYFNKLNHLKYFIKYDIEFIINYNIGSTLLEQGKVKEAGLYLNNLENKSYEYNFENFKTIHKLAYYNIEIQNQNKAKKYIQWLVEYAKQNSSIPQLILDKIIDSLKIKQVNSNFIDDKTYQKDIEYIFNHAQKDISYGFKQFYFHDIEKVYLTQRRYKDLYYLYSKKGN